MPVLHKVKAIQGDNGSLHWNHTKLMHTLCEQNAELLTLKHVVHIVSYL
jgi:hypothetical protein